MFFRGIGKLIDYAREVERNFDGGEFQIVTGQEHSFGAVKEFTIE